MDAADGAHAASQQQATPPPPAAVTVGAWRLQNELGRGSFAVVYLATHSKTAEQAAVKEVQTQRLSRKLLASLESEINILKRARHPNIVSLKDLWKSSSRIYLVLEYADGGDLLAFIRKHKRLAHGTARHFMAHLGAGLRVLRQHNLVHRDLKPQNLLLSTAPANAPTPKDAVTGQPLPVLKIADFGFARNLQPQGLAETLCGSPLYMAPEVLHGQRYDAKADLWSVGAILFEMVAGAPPYGGANYVALLQNIEAREASLPADVARTAAPSLVSLLRMLLRRSPIERLSFDEFFRHPYMRDAMAAAAAAANGDAEPPPSADAPMPHIRSSDSLDGDYVIVEENPAPPPPGGAGRQRTNTAPAAMLRGAAATAANVIAGSAVAAAAAAPAFRFAVPLAAAAGPSAPPGLAAADSAATEAAATYTRREGVARQLRDLATESWERGERTAALSLQMLALRVLRNVANGAKDAISAVTEDRGAGASLDLQAVASRAAASLNVAVSQAEVAVKRILRDGERQRASALAIRERASSFASDGTPPQIARTERTSSAASQGVSFASSATSSASSTTRGSTVSHGASLASDCSMESAGTHRPRSGSSNAATLAASPGQLVPPHVAMVGDACSPSSATMPIGTTPPSPKAPAATAATPPSPKVTTALALADRVVLPDALELAYQSALRDGRAGAVQELVGAHDVAAACYHRAVSLLSFLLQDAEALDSAGSALSLSDTQRTQLATYRAGLENRWAAVTAKGTAHGTRV